MAGTTVAKYELASGEVAKIRVSPSTLGATINTVGNAEPSGDATLETKARRSGSGRAYGIHARVIYAKYTGALPTGVTSPLVTIPWLKQSAWAAIKPDDTGTYQGVAIKVIGKRAEKVK